MRFDQVLPPHQLKISLKIPMLLYRPRTADGRAYDTCGAVLSMAQRPRQNCHSGPIWNRHTVDDHRMGHAKSVQAWSRRQSDVRTASASGAGSRSRHPQSGAASLLPTTFSMCAIYHLQEIVDDRLRIVIVSFPRVPAILSKGRAPPHA